MRLICALLSAFSCMALGFHAAQRLDRRARLLRIWHQALENMARAAHYEHAAVPGLLRAGARAGDTPLQCWAERLENDPACTLASLIPEKCSDFTACEWQDLCRCLESLGSESRDIQLSALDSGAAAFAQYAACARADHMQKHRLYLSLGCLTGAALFILLI